MKNPLLGLMIASLTAASAFAGDTPFPRSVTDVLRECKVYQPGAGWTPRPGTGEWEHSESQTTHGYCIGKVVVMADKTDLGGKELAPLVGATLTLEFYRTEEAFCSPVQALFHPKGCKLLFIDMYGHPAGYRISDQDGRVIIDDSTE